MNLFFSYPSAIITFSALLLFWISEKRVVPFDEVLCIFRGSSTEASSIWFLSFALRKKCPYSKLFWSAFSLMRSEYGEVYSFWMRESADQKIRNTATFTQSHGHFSHSIIFPVTSVRNIFFRDSLRLSFNISNIRKLKHVFLWKILGNRYIFLKSQFIEKPWLGNLMYKKRNLLVMLKLMSHHHDLGHCKKRWRKAKM